MNWKGSSSGCIVFPLTLYDKRSIFIVPFALWCYSRFSQAPFGALLRCTFSSVIPLQLLVSVIHATCAFRNLPRFTLLPSKKSALMLSPSLSCCQFSLKAIRVAWYTTLWLHVNQLAAILPSNAAISNLVGICTCCTAAVIASAASSELLAICCKCWVSAWLTALLTICAS